ncbi:oligosaccharide flippase family protein, partial [Escherichia coli]|nr:oligosaccharide flippase family protein [Escherichia coli]
ALIGYASIFDAGISRAVIREIALYRESEKEQIQIISTASVIVLFLGVVAALLLYFSSNKVVELLNVSSVYIETAVRAFSVISFIIPVYLINQIWLGYLEGLEKFANINVQRMISSTSLAILPVIFCYYNPSLLYAMYGLVVGRVISFLISAIICRDIILKSKLYFNVATCNRLISFGGWITVSNIISPIMAYFDRFIISHIMGASRIAFYTAPSEGVSRLINIPYALARALFPKLAYSNNDDERKKLQLQSYAIISIVCLPIVVIGVIFASFIMTTWMGPDYALEAATIMKILLAGFFFNSLAQIPYAYLQSIGKSKITAFVHLIELAPYLLLLYYFTMHFGIIGTAIAWSLRTFCDFVILLSISRRK